ncbi:hypothetical protein E1165_02245 [Micromonospora sp. KC723]|nr:hypothetical protein E1165_02245 [Micromonospora sp. KC723]
MARPGGRDTRATDGCQTVYASRCPRPPSRNRPPIWTPTCDQTGCPRRTFTEQVPQIPARARLTRRLRQRRRPREAEQRPSCLP